MNHSHKDSALKALQEMEEVEFGNEDSEAITLGLKALTHAVLSIGNDFILLARELHSITSRLGDGPNFRA